jgi:predicted transcriptional regulator YheO
VRKNLIKSLVFLGKFIKNNFHNIVKVGEKYMKTISVQITDEEKELFNAKCKELDLTMSYMLRKFIKDFIANKAKEEVVPGNIIG